MVERGRGTSLAAKTLQRLRIAGDVIRKEFERNETAQFGVLGLVHHAHTAAAEFFDDVVARNGLANHLSRILRGQKRQVNECRDVGQPGMRNRQGIVYISRSDDAVPNFALIRFDGWIDNSSGVNVQLGLIQFRGYH
jgi:hypothetical protein